MSEQTAWFIFLAPLASFVIISLILRPFFNGYPRLSGYLTILAIGASLVLSVVALQEVMGGGGGAIGWEGTEWLKVGPLDFRVGILMNPLTGIMLIVVSGVSLLVQVYSQGYMRGDPGYSRYYAYMSLFTASMLGLVLSGNIVLMFVFWELVGLCSYLLIGFWYQRPAAAAAAKKAFLVTRLGDFGFLLAILYIFSFQPELAGEGLNALETPDLAEAVHMGLIGTGAITWMALGIFAGAVGKSAQFPLHTWLPDAMEGPTPVSSLIHAATMVAAGVFLVGRMFFLFEESAAAMNVVAIIGGVTALFAATMGLVMYDIKRVLAYSTISQLGYMMLALGVGAFGAAFFHLLTHAFFKCLLFLGSGSVNHATGTFDMRYMGGLRRHMPWTYATFLVGSLALAGVFPFAGFWSKDEILAEAFSGELASSTGVSQIAFWLGIVAALLTAFYIFRALFMTFHGEFKGGAEADPAPPPGDHHVHLGESPLVMVLPMTVLALVSIVAGFLVNPISSGWGLGLVPAHWLSGFLEPELHAPEFNTGLAVVSLAIALAGIGLAYMLYMVRQPAPERVAGAAGPVHTLFFRKYYMDELYEDVVTRRVWFQGVCNVLEWVDRNLVDAFMDLVGWQGRNWGQVIARLQTGQVQFYGATISVGVIVILAAFLIWG